MRRRDVWKMLRRAVVFARPYRGWLAGGGALTLTSGALGAVEPLLLKRIFDGLAGGAEAFELVAWALAALLALGLAREAAIACANWITWRTRLRIHQDLLGSTVTRLHRLPASFQRTEGVGAIMTRLERGIQGFVTSLSEIVFNVLPAVAFLVLGVVIMARLDWRLLLVILVFTPLPGTIAVAAAPRQIRRETSLLDRWARIYSRFNEVLSGIVTVRSFAMEDAEKGRFLSQVRLANRLVVRGVGFDSGVGAAQNLVVVLARVAALAYGGYLVVEGEVTLGTLVAFLGYVAGLFGPVQGLATVYRTLNTGAASVAQVFAILDTQEHLGDAPDAVPLAEVRGEVSFEDVHFAYAAEGRPMLQGIDLHVAPGEVVALVGPSGSGKSTLMALLQRFYDPDRGVVRIDGMDLRRLKQQSLRRHIAVVLQDAVLFNDSVADNIAYGRPAASREEIVAAARAAQAHGFIERLPEGYDTVVGERGSLLSVGERQRVAIARALLKDSPILILDEATSALDPQSEAALQEALDRLMEGRTTFIIAHRLTTVVGADRIVVLRDGKVVEEGSHRELLRRAGDYARLVEHQTRGLLADGHGSESLQRGTS